MVYILPSQFQSDCPVSLDWTAVSYMLVSSFKQCVFTFRWRINNVFGKRLGFLRCDWTITALWGGGVLKTVCNCVKKRKLRQVIFVSI